MYKQIIDYYESAINTIAYGCSIFDTEYMEYPIWGILLLVSFYVLVSVIYTFHIPSRMNGKGKHLALGTKLWYLLNEKSLKNKFLGIDDFLIPILMYLVIMLNMPPWSLHDLALKISFTLIGLHSLMFLTCIALEYYRARENKRIGTTEDHLQMTSQKNFRR